METDTVNTEYGPVPKQVWDLMTTLFFAAEKCCCYTSNHEDDLNDLGRAVDQAGKLILGPNED